MASVSYPVTTLTAGVSTQQYSLRMDGQASAQSNVLNSAQHGLAKRPPTKYLATVETNGVWDAPLMFPLVYGGREQLYVYGANNPQVVSCLTGDVKQMAVFPSSGNPATSSYAAYGMLGAAAPNQLSHVRVGDVTFIANHTKQPAMKSTAWQGYTSKSAEIRKGDDSGFLSVGAIKNDDVWTAWVQKIDPNNRGMYKITWTEDLDGTVAEHTSAVERWKAGLSNSSYWGYDLSVGDQNQLGGQCAANALHVCTKLGFRASNVENANDDNMMQATSLTGASYADRDFDFHTIRYT